MTITIDPSAIAAALAFFGVLFTALGALIGFRKLRTRIATVQADVKEVKADVKQILAMLHTLEGYHQGLAAGRGQSKT